MPVLTEPSQSLETKTALPPVGALKKTTPGNFHVGNTVRYSPGLRGLWLKLKNKAAPDLMHLLLLRSALRQAPSPSGMTNIGAYQIKTSDASAFLQQYKSSLPATIPDVDCCPGADWLGYGYRPFGPIVNSDSSSREPLFQLLDYDQYRFNGKDYIKPKIVMALDENEANCQTVQENAAKDAFTEISSKFFGGANFGFFKGELQLAFSLSLKSYWEYRFAAFQMYLRMLRLTLPATMSTYLAPNFKAALNNATADAKAKAARRKMTHGTDFTSFFNTWGTHYISGIHVGGVYNFYMKFESTSYSTTMDIDQKVSATCAVLQGGNETDISAAMNGLSSRDEVNVTAYGGIDEPIDWTDLAQWQIAVRANPAFSQFYGTNMEGLTPIYTLVSDNAGKTALKHEWDNYCSANKLVLSGIGTVVTALNIGCDDDAQKANTQASNNGAFNVIPVDLNEGAGGPYIFIGQKYGNADTEKPLLDLVGVTGSQNVQAPAGYYKYPTDLNKGVGGAYIYLCSTCDPTGRELLLPIRNVGVESYSDKRDPAFFTARGLTVVSEAGSSDSLDMNRGAGGKFVYVTFTRG